MLYEHVPPQKVWFCGVPENVAFYDLFEVCEWFFENDTLGSEIGSGFRELGAKSAQPPPPGMKLANYSSTVAGVETVHIFCGNCQRSQSYKVHRSLESEKNRLQKRAGENRFKKTRT